MKVSFIGLGKLGLPVAVAIDAKGHNVLGYDINPNINSNKTPLQCLHTEEKNENLDGPITSMLINSGVKFSDSLEECIKFGDIVFVAIQTPHDSKFGGQIPLTEEREDFNYTYLVNCVKEIGNVLDKLKMKKIVSIISTVLPGTLRSFILPIISDNISLCYNPYFIAMGTVVNDFYNPEFILLGRIDDDAERELKQFYSTITNAPVFSTSLENAELIKVSYNTFITTKVVLINNLMEMCHHLPNTNIDEVSSALKLATKRLCSTSYLNGGMGDGGGCHPRDNIAMSWLSDRLGIKNNYYNFIMEKREDQSQFLANIVKDKKQELNLPVCILGIAFKPETNLKDGSTALLLIEQLKEMNIEVESFDPYINNEEFIPKEKIYFLGCAHKIFNTYNFIKGSHVIDPHRYLRNIEGVTYTRIGIGPLANESV